MQISHRVIISAATLWIAAILCDFRPFEPIDLQLKSNTARVCDATMNANSPIDQKKSIGGNPSAYSTAAQYVVCQKQIDSQSKPVSLSQEFPDPLMSIPFESLSLTSNPDTPLESLSSASKSMATPASSSSSPKTVIQTSSTSTTRPHGTNARPRRYMRAVACMLTAYGPGYASTGKRPGDPAYGITSSGTHATEGKTIAVDPKIIPIGSTVYIEGLGYRTAEDVGGAVKGPHIDIFFNNDDVAAAFGVKQSVQVYVLSPSDET